MPAKLAPRRILKTGISLDLAAIRDHKPDFSGFEADILAEIIQAYIAAYQSAAPDQPVNTALRERAAEFAQERMSGLIEDLSDATQDRIRELVADAVGNGDSIQQLRNRLMADDAFSKSRAETIAVTETAYALGRAQREYAESIDQDEKSWVAESDCCASCGENEGSGWIGINETFSGGDDNIPGHPKCRCDVIYRTRRVHEDAAVVQVVKEAACETCGRWVGRNVNADATVYCPKCKETRIALHA